MKYLIIIILFAVIACHKRKSDCGTSPTYQGLSQSATEWFPYQANKSLYFENTTLQADTLELKSFFSGDDSVWNGDGCPMTRAAFLRGNIKDKKSGDTIKTEIGLGERVIF
jgi:hypothetical protein